MRTTRECEGLLPAVAGLAFRGRVLREVAEQYGTPSVLLSGPRVAKNAQALREALVGHGRGFFSSKACYVGRVQQTVVREGLGLEVCSGGELLLALRSGVAPAEICWNAVALSDEELGLLVAHDVGLVGLNTRADLERVARAHAAAGRKRPIFLRVHPGTARGYLERDGRLGFDLESGEALEAARLVAARPSLELVGLHGHCLAGRTSPTDHVVVGKELGAFARALHEAFGMKVRQLNLGGGLAAASALERAGWPIAAFVDTLAQELRSLLPWPVELVLEPGRYVVEDAAVALCRVLGERRAGEARWAIVDLACNYLQPFGGRTFSMLVVDGAASGGASSVAAVGDATCSEAGVLAREVRLPEAAEGQLLVVPGVGHYTESVAHRFMRGLPGLVWDDGAATECLRTPEGAEAWLAATWGGSSLP
ncbi:MAG: hypothetical protein IT371_16195 [Deltaproteobacteria bacterium]|nr:hypothetical protein [Deltaproteobacteria bacterium]